MVVALAHVNVLALAHNVKRSCRVQELPSRIASRCASWEVKVWMESYWPIPEVLDCRGV